MGYYTRHDLEIIKGDDNVTNYKEEISKTTGYDDCFDDEIKWYSHPEDMLAFSKKHPNTLFKITGVGEEQPDLWEEYYQNGKMCRIEGDIVFEEFKIEMLA